MIVDAADMTSNASRMMTALARNRNFRLRACALSRSIHVPSKPRKPPADDRGLSEETRQDFETRANSSFGLLICPSEMTSRRNSPPRIQSNRIRIRRFHVGIALR